MQSNEDYINTIKRIHFNRKRNGYIGLVLSVIVGIGIYFSHGYFQKEARNGVVTISSYIAGTQMTETTVKNIHYATDYAQEYGSAIGLYIGILSAGTLMSFIQSLILIFGGRKESLLIKYYEQTKT